jgi:hypothetical protein
MISGPALNVVDREFEFWSGQTKDYKIGICCFSAKYASLRSKTKDWFGSEVERHVYPQTFVSVSWHYKNPTKMLV